MFQAEFECYLVGGAVRDQLLGRPIQDRDWVVVGESTASMQARGFRMVGKSFPVFLHPESGEEYALARTESKSGPGYHGFACHTDGISLEQDLARRDLTINAIAFNGEQYIDPFGGLKDIQNQSLRHTSSAFSEDPLRVLRLARFASQLPQFNVHPDTKHMVQQVQDLEHIHPQRIWGETEKALQSGQPSRFFSLLKEFLALETLFPELYALIQTPHSHTHHQEGDVFQHTLLVLKEAQKHHNPTLNFTALCHDLGKGLTPKSELPRHHGHEFRSLDAIESLSSRIPIPKSFLYPARYATRYHMLFSQSRKIKPRTFLKMFRGARQERFIDIFILLGQSDLLGRIPQVCPQEHSDRWKEAWSCYKGISFDNAPNLKDKDAIIQFQTQQLTARLRSSSLDFNA